MTVQLDMLWVLAGAGLAFVLFIAMCLVCWFTVWISDSEEREAKRRFKRRQLELDDARIIVGPSQERPLS